ncbi:MAG TPA: SidA/IucD/PvdA family monooxygenase [Sphingomicrobium sp.]|nr:SidA/IucD/PvdA family monooxygenase [Sphingomicrobium sp.]
MARQRLAIIGAGPKAVAIATKAACLRDLAALPLEVVIFERDVIGAAWTGQFGYTDGLQRLCTPAERDVGFPYDTDLAADLDRAMLARFSWTAFQIETERYGDWVDRGRPKPTHQDFAQYLAWCLSGLGPIRFGPVTALKHRNGRWSVRYTSRDSGASISEGRFDGVVVTGPGPQSTNLRKVADGRIFDGVDFWRPGVIAAVKQAAASGPDDPVVIIGSGGTAAATAAALVRADISNDIRVLGSQAALYARADSYFENRTFRDPKFWSALSAADRRTFSDRLTRGAVWSNVVNVLAGVERIDYLQGAAKEVRFDPPGTVGGALMVVYAPSAHPDAEVPLQASAVIDATGFDPMWFRTLLSPSLARKLNNEKKMRTQMASDLSLPLEGVPRLHVPMISQAVGPAYNSLMALGSLSDAVLRPYVSAALA